MHGAEVVGVEKSFRRCQCDDEARQAVVGTAAALAMAMERVAAHGG